MCVVAIVITGGISIVAFHLHFISGVYCKVVLWICDISSKFRRIYKYRLFICKNMWYNSNGVNDLDIVIVEKPRKILIFGSICAFALVFELSSSAI